jgi:hypothetical protein
MQRDLVESKGWVSSEDYYEGLAFSQLSPGPLAAQLANYLGWVHSGIRGAILTGVAFVMPSLLMVLALAAAYVQMRSTGGECDRFKIFREHHRLHSRPPSPAEHEQHEDFTRAGRFDARGFGSASQNGGDRNLGARVRLG